jgi:Na+-transporting NADH:ubiquinone oxidoreductase subunit C
MTALVALVLSLMYTGLKGVHDNNEAVYAKKAILAAVQNKLGIEASTLKDAEVQEIFDSSIKQEVYDMKGNLLTPEQVESAGYKGGLAENVDINKEAKKPESERILPMYRYKDDKNEFTILSVQGKGLWDVIWGNIAFEKDGRTIAGVDFDHKAETPGLGAEIKDNAAWKRQFIGKTIIGPDGNYTGIAVMKGGARDPNWQVDGISGATITADGVGEMMSRGLKYYQPIMKMAKS